MSLNEFYLQQIMQAHLLWNVSMKSILVTNYEWEKSTAHATCSFVDLSGYVFGDVYYR